MLKLPGSHEHAFRAGLLATVAGCTSRKSQPRSGASPTCPSTGDAACTTTSAGCTVTPLKPVYDHTNSSGNKVIKYETKVYCDAGRSIEILDERRDQDNYSLDDFEGSKVYNLRFDSADTVTPEAGCREIASKFPNATYRSLPELGHASQIEGPELVNEMIREFAC